MLYNCWLICFCKIDVNIWFPSKYAHVTHGIINRMLLNLQHRVISNVINVILVPAPLCMVLPKQDRNEFDLVVVLNVNTYD